LSWTLNLFFYLEAVYFLRAARYVNYFRCFGAICFIPRWRADENEIRDSDKAEAAKKRAVCICFLGCIENNEFVVVSNYICFFGCL